MDEIIKEFLQESTENLDSLDRQFVLLEGQPCDRDILGAVFRTIHTIKGATGFLGFRRLEALTHAGENLLSRLRDGDFTLNAEMTSALLLMVDAVRRMLAAIEAAGAEPEENAEKQEIELIAMLNRLAQGGAGPTAIETAIQTKKTEIEITAEAAAPVTAPIAVAEAIAPKSVAEFSVRVDVALLDQLMDLMGELVLARNQIVQFAAQTQDKAPAFLPLAQRLNLLTSDLRERITKTRMQPAEQLFTKLPSMLRGLSLSCGKKVKLETAGGQTEIDRSILDAVRDPLAHAVRNAVDHGIELPAERAARGKAECGTVRISARHDSGLVVLEIADDGAGLDLEKLRSKAIERGLLEAEAALRLSDQQVRELIFLPGFSTAAKVSNISGRGVGMDVVRTNVEKIGGTVELQSEHGSGTTLRFRIPLTLAIIPALMVQSAGQAFALPQMNLVELLQIPQTGTDCVESIGGALVYRLRGRLLPMISLRDLLMKSAPQTYPQSQPLSAVVLRFGERSFGLVVEQIEDAEEIVVKPLGRLLAAGKTTLFAGAAVRGDGAIALILDVNALAAASHIFASQAHPAEDDLCEVFFTSAAQQRRQVLYVRAGGRMAVGLDAISRIEQLKPEQITELHGEQVFEHQGRILPLIDLRSNDVRSTDVRSSAADPLSVLVCEDGALSAGVVVEEVLDCGEEDFRLETRWADGACREGAAILREGITGLLDLSSVMRSRLAGAS